MLKGVATTIKDQATKNFQGPLAPTGREPTIRLTWSQVVPTTFPFAVRLNRHLPSGHWGTGQASRVAHTWVHRSAPSVSLSPPLHAETTSQRHFNPQLHAETTTVNVISIHNYMLRQQSMSFQSTLTFHKLEYLTSLSKDSKLELMHDHSARISRKRICMNA